MSDDIKKDLKNTPGDIAHIAVKTCLASIPIVGGVASEIFNTVIAPPIEKRRDDWLINIFTTLQEMQDKIAEFSMDELSQNEMFISTITKASQLAVRNHQEEKLKALHNAVINSALNIAIDENEQMMFLNMIDSFTPWHLKLVYYFENPVKRFQENNITRPEFMMGGIRDGLNSLYPELSDRGEFVGAILNDLFNNKIVNTSNLGGGMTNDGIYAPRLTAFGEKFLKYVQTDI